jgi:hypothetical protein
VILQNVPHFPLNMVEQKAEKEFVIAFALACTVEGYWQEN